MTSFIISLDEMERVKKRHGLRSNVDLAKRTGVSRNTWGKALRDRRPTPQVLDALAALGADPRRILVADEELNEQAA